MNSKCQEYQALSPTGTECSVIYIILLLCM